MLDKRKNIYILYIYPVSSTLSKIPVIYSVNSTLPIFELKFYPKNTPSTCSLHFSPSGRVDNLDVI